MTNLTEVSSFDAVYQLETTDDVIGGAGGISNLQPQQLANRTRYLLNALQSGAAGYAADTGSANTYVANLSPAIAALVDGMEVRLKAANANTGASTFTPRSGTIPALPVYAGDHAALIGGEIVQDGEITLRYNASLNTPNGAWVIMSSTGGTLHAQTPAVGNNTTEAATMAALFNAADGMATVGVGGAGNVTLTKAQYGMAMLNLTGTPSIAKDLLFPAQTGMWVVANNQGGSNNITAKTTAVGSTGKVLPAGTAVIIYSDGTNIAFASSSSQVSFTPVSITGVTGTSLTVAGGYTVGNIMVEKNGGMLQPADYTASNGTSITLNTAAVSTDKFTVYVFQSFTVANAVLKSGDTMTGPLVLPGNASNPLEAVPKQQLDAVAAAIAVSPGSFKNLQVSTSGTGPAVNVSYDALVLSDGLGNYLTDIGASGTINTTSTGAGGLDTGVLASSTWYSLWRIAKSDGTKSWLFSLSATAPTMPTGYTLKARIGWIRTDGTANKYPLSTKQAGRRVQYVAAAATNTTGLPVMASGTTSSVAVSTSAFVPPTASKISVCLNGTYAGNGAGVGPNSTYTTGSNANSYPLILSAQGTATNLGVTGEMVLESSNIYWYATGGSSLNCLGWEDNI